MRLLFLALLTICALSDYQIYRHPTTSSAKCLDGSPAAYYLSIGDPNKILIYFEGGGLCGGYSLTETLDSCFKRSSTNLGSSSKYPATRNYDKRGILSSVESVNPGYYNWTKVYIPYCDGSLHQGSRSAPVSYKNKDLYFRGSNNTIETLRHLNETISLFGQSKKVLVTGVSAGAVATYLWSNYIFDNSLSKDVISVPDSGIFINQFVNPFSGKQEMVDSGQALRKIVNTECNIPIAECAQAYPDLAECFSAGVIPKYLKNPFFIIESQYDLYDIGVAIGLNCTPNTHPSTMTACNDTQKAAIQSYRQATLEAFSNFTKLMSGTGIGIWAPSCIQHGFQDEVAYTSDKYRVPTRIGITLSQAILKFMTNPKGKENIFVDSIGWPGNTGCSGLNLIY